MDQLIDVESLALELAGPNPPALLDVRWSLGGPLGIEQYRAGHLPGAVFADLDADLAGSPGAAGRHPLPETAVFQAAMRRAGVRGDRPVVAYDQDNALAAARAWWLLRYFGHQQVRILDGGYSAWVSAGRPVAAEQPVPGTSASGTSASGASAPGAGDFTARPGQMPLLDAPAAAAVARAGVLLDARAAERYRGEAEPVDPVAGHIPGAVSAPTVANVGPDGRFLDQAELRARFAGLGVLPADGTVEGGEPRPGSGSGSGSGPASRPGPDRTVGAYCGSGVTAAHEVLALEIAGIPAALYIGSWSNWVADPERPVATGSAPG